MAATEFCGYTDLECAATVKAIVSGDKTVDFAESGEKVTVILDKTPFYGEGGGQIGDIGVLSGNGFTFTVTGTQKTAEGVYLHHGYVSEGENIAVGQTVMASVDRITRLSTMRNHTAAHILQATLRKMLGTHVEQAGQLVNSEEMRFDFSHFSALTTEELADIEAAVNAVIFAAEPVETAQMSIDEAKKMGAMALFSEKYGDVVRVVKIGNYSTELCGGTHVQNTSMLGLFKIVSETSVAAGVRRITAVTGIGVLEYIQKNNALIADAAASLKVANPQDLVRRATAVAAELKEKDREIQKLQAEINNIKTAGLMAGAVDVNGVQLVVYYAGEAGADALRSMAETARDSAPNTVAVIAGTNAEKGTVSFACACGKDAIAKGAHAGNIVREVAKIAGGNGGGKPDMAMAGGKDASKVDDALMRADEILRNMLK